MEDASAAGRWLDVNADAVAARPRSDLLTPVALAALALLAGVVVLRSAANLLYPYALTDTENTVFCATWRAARGMNFYGYADNPPFVIFVYNPLFVGVSALAMRVFGETPAAVRAVSLLSYAAAALAAYLFVERQTGMRRAGLVAAGFLLIERHLFARAGHGVVDYSAVFFSLLGLYLWTFAGLGRMAAVAAFVLGFFCKQSALVAPAAAFAWLFSEGRRREAAMPALAFLASVGVGLLCCRAFFGTAYLINAFMYVRGGAFLPSKAIAQVAKALLLSAVPVGGLFVMSRQALSTKRLPLVAWYAALGLLASSAVGMEGAGYGYFFDFVAAMSVIAGLMWAKAVARSRTAGLRPAIAAFTVLQLGLLAAGVAPEVTGLGRMRLSALADRSESAVERDRLVREAYEKTDGFILCRETAMEMGARARSVASDLYKISQLVRLGRLPGDTMTKLVTPPSRCVSLVIIPENDAAWGLFPDELRREVEANYQLECETSGLAFYRPRPARTVVED